MLRLRADVEAKLHAMPLSYLDRQARGDLLSRVTNDIDNVSQSMQQSLSQLLTGLLTIAGTIAMMLWISWQLAIVAIVTVPLSIMRDEAHRQPLEAASSSPSGSTPAR